MRGGRNTKKGGRKGVREGVREGLSTEGVRTTPSGVTCLTLSVRLRE